MHARGVNPSVLRADPRSMHPRAKVSWQWTKCTLPLRANSVPKQKMHRSCTKRRMDNLAVERTDRRTVHLHLPTAGIVDPTRKIEHRQFNLLIGSWPSIPIKRGRIVCVTSRRIDPFASRDQTDHRCRSPISLRARDRQTAIVEQPKAIGVSKARCDHTRLEPLWADPHESLIA